MSYILRKDKCYCYVDGKRRINHIDEIHKATRFHSKKEAECLLNRACTKLKGYEVVDLNTLDLSKSIRRTFTANERLIIYNKNKGRCAICGQFVPYDKFTVDHIIPLSKGGTNDLKNLQCACKTCNAIKQDILPDELMDKLIQIVLYQMRKNYDESLWNKINHLHKRNKKQKIKNAIKVFSK